MFVDSSYVCPYCGSEVTKENVLFFWDDNKAGVHSDKKRSDFRVEHGMPTVQGYLGLYFSVTDKNVEKTDDNGFPTMLSVYENDGKTPEELLDESEFFGSDEDEFADESEEDKPKMKLAKRSCPHCHSQLPQEFGKLKTFHVTAFGGRASGKTAYFVNLLQQLPYQLEHYGIGSVKLESESEAYWKPILEKYAENGVIDPTPKAKGLMPIVLRFDGEGENAPSAFFILTDIAGEAVADENYMARHRGISEAENMLLMIDPNMLCGGTYYMEWILNQPDQDSDDNMINSGLNFESHDYCREALGQFLSNAGKLAKFSAEHLKNVIVVVTKMDMMLTAEKRYFATGDIELLKDISSKYRGKLDLLSVIRIEQELTKFFTKRFSNDLKDRIKNTFGSEKKINLLGVSTSTLKRNDKHDDFFFSQEYAVNEPKFRIIEPFLLLLWRCNLIKGIKPDKEDGRVILKEIIGDRTLLPAEVEVEVPKRVGLIARLFGGGRK